jgi:hypothetical protein
MTGSRLQLLVLAFCACSVGSALAGSGDITKRDQNGGSVELSNLGDEDAPVVVSAPAHAVAAVARPAPIPAARPTPAPEVVAGERQPEQKRARDKGEEETVAGEQGSESRGELAGAGSANRDAYAGGGVGFAGGYGYGAGTGSTGVVDTGPGGGSSPNSGPNNSPSPGGTPPNVGSPSTPSAATPTLPPTALEQRWQNYQQIMLNQERGPNGQPPNPAVQRRYLMGLGR